MNKTLTILVCIMVAGVVVGASLPIFDSLTASSESVHNEGAGWVRFALDRNAGTTYSLSYTEDENGFYIDNGTDRQTYDDSSTVGFDTILYADSNLSVWVDGAIHILGTNEGNPFYLEGSGALTIVRDADGVTVTPDGLDPVTFGVPTWSYIPVSTGNYGFFLASDLDNELGNGVKNYPSDMPLAVVGGGFAGVYAYNDIYRYNGLGLNMHPVYDEEGLFYGAYWDQTAPVEPESLNPDVLDPAIIDLDPIDIDLDPLDPGAQIMSVPTPTYTDGDWGYDTTTVDGVTKAKIVSYSGAGGGAITVPSTIGGYDVYQLGKGGASVTVFETTLSATDLIISPGIEIIKDNALAYCTGFTGSLVIPDSVTSIDTAAFRGCTGFTGSLVIPDSVTSIGNFAFNGCTGFTGSLVIPDSVTSIGGESFRGCTGFTGSLVIPSSVTSIGSNAFRSCTGFDGSLIIGDGVTSIDTSAFESDSGFTGSLVIPSSVTSIGSSAFRGCSGFTNLIVISDATVNTYTYYSSGFSEVLDLSDDIEYSAGSYGIPADAIVSNSIGDCFGFVSIVDLSGNGGGPTQTLIAMLPLIMVLGLVLMAVGLFIWNRM